MKNEIDEKDEIASSISNSTSCRITPPPPLMPKHESSPNNPFITKSPYGTIVVDRFDIPLLPPEIEVQKVFKKAASWGIFSTKLPTLAIYNQVCPIIQRGPQCGLVALSMASYAFPPFVSTELLLEEAKAMGISNHGEMFCSSDFANLANNSLNISAVVRRDVLSSAASILEVLKDGNLLLVPYDSDRNHTPANNNGHTAHWSLICGCLLQFNSFSLIPSCAKQDAGIPNLWHYQNVAKDRESIGSINNTLSSARCQDDEEIYSACNEHRFIVMWRQGKSRNLTMSKLSELRESNEQLAEYPDDDDKYVIKSVLDGLAGQAIVLTDRSHDLV